MEANKITVNIRASYEWHEADASRLRKPIEEYLLPALPAANYVAASITHQADGFEQQEDFASALAWLTVLDQPAASYRLYLSQGANTLDLNVSATNVNVGMRGEAARALEFRAHLENFAAAAGLKRVEIKRINPPVLPVRTTGFRRMGSYRLLEDATADTWLKAVNLISAWVGDAPSFNGTLAFLDDPGTVQDVRALAPWSEAVAQRWADLASAGMHAFQQPRSANLQAQFADRNVTLNATAEDSEAVRGIFADFQSTLQVAPRVSGDLKGERRRFYIAAGIDPHWIRTLADILGVFRRSGFSGTFRIEDQEYSVQDFDAWISELLQRWGSMRAAGGVLSNESSRLAFDIDFDREQIALDLRTRPGVPAVKSFSTPPN